MAAGGPVRASDYNMLNQFIDDPNTMRLCQTNTSFHVAMLVRRGKIIQTASNRVGTRSRGSGYSKYTIHAEKNVIKQIRNLHLLDGCDLFIMKIHQHKLTKELTFCHSSPCHSCQVFIEKCQKEYGLKNVYYTEFP